MVHSPLRVLFVSHAYVVGVNQGKLNAIAETGEVEVGLLAPSNWKALEWNRLIPVERPFSNFKIYEEPVLFSGKGGAHIFSPWKLWQILKDFKPDLVQIEEEVFSLSTFEISIWAKINKKPFVVFGWENMERKLPLFRQKTCQFVLDTASAIIPGNEDGAKIMRKWGYLGLLEVMPQMGVDTILFSPPSLRKSINQFNIGFLGRLVSSKGIDVLFAAISQMRERGVNCSASICGSGTSEAELRQKAKDLGIQDYIDWRGAIKHEEAPQEISRMDVLVLPSRTTSTWKEQFGHVLIEAMAMGVPVVGSSSGEIPHVIGRQDLVFQEDNSQDLARILERLACEPNWHNEIRQYGIQRVNQLYSHQKIADRLINLWKTILKGKNNVI
jgi:glycosyltransferase involved in cell wall biosynthesis